MFIAIWRQLVAGSLFNEGCMEISPLTEVGQIIKEVLENSMAISG